MTTNDWLKRLTASSILGLTLVTGVKLNEGYSEKAYYDGARVATICYGETKGVKMGQVRTKAQCDTQLKQSIAEHAKVLDGVPSKTPDVVVLGSMDMAYNVGVNGFNSSKVKKAIIAGDYATASQEVLKWKYITINGKKFDCSVKGNKVCYGLWKRRLWQSRAVGNQFKSPQEAIDELDKLYH